MGNAVATNSWVGGSLAARPKPLPRWLFPLLALLLIGGIAAFFIRLASTEPAGAWHIFLVNFLFWSGVPTAGIALAAVFEISNARWPTAVKRLAQPCAAYLPLSFFLFLVMWFGRDSLLPWATQPRPAIASWLNVPFLFIREGVGLLLLYGISLVFSYRPLRTTPGTLRKLAAALLIVYAVVYTLLAWDLVMSLHPGWSSTLFGAYYFVGNLYLGLAFLITLANFARWRYDLGDALGSKVFHSLGKLLFSFSLLWIYLFWSQYLVIWYGNLPHEIGFVLVRTAQQPWSQIAVAVLAMNFLLPFVVLLPRASKENRKTLLISAIVIISGMWLERFLLVIPSLTSAQEIPLDWTEALITGGFFASFALVYLIALDRFVTRKRELNFDGGSGGAGRIRTGE